MGLLRFLLALVVVVGHVNYLAFLNKTEIVTLFNHDFAVLIFFIISGYYMTLILDTKIIYRHYFTFIRARYLRLYPLYSIVLLLTLSLMPVLGNGYEVFKTCSNSGWYVAFGCTASSLTLIGLDGFPWFTFYSLKPGNFMPQTWSIGSEVLFYLVIPFFFSRKWLVLLMLILGMVSNYIWHDHRIWNTGFNNYYLFYYYFLFGVVSYHFIKPFKIDSRVAYILLPCIIISLLGYGILPAELRAAVAQHYFWYTNLTAVIVTLILPTLFNITKNNKTDRFIGELSYSIYIIHILVINITRYFMPNPIRADGSRNYLDHTEILIVISATLILSIVYNSFIGSKIEKLRHGILLDKDVPHDQKTEEEYTRQSETVFNK